MNNRIFKTGGASGLYGRCARHARTGRLGHRPFHPLTVSNAAFSKDICDGAQAYFKSVNVRGGVGGKNIELFTPDDANDRKTVGDNTRKQLSYCRPCP